MNIKMSNPLRRYQIFFLALGVFCVAAVAVNLVVRRVPVHDATIENDLAAIASAVDAYSANHNSLPDNLTQLTGLSPATKKRLSDYEYIPGRTNQYELCATFLGVGQSTVKSYAPLGGTDDTSVHGKGRECFTYRANPPYAPAPSIR